MLWSSFLLPMSPAITRHGGITFAGLETNTAWGQFVPRKDLLFTQIINFPHRDAVAPRNRLLINQSVIILRSTRHRARGCCLCPGARGIGFHVWRF